MAPKQIYPVYYDCLFPQVLKLYQYTLETKSPGIGVRSLETTNIRGGSVTISTMSLSDILDHELIHAMTGMNGESYSLGQPITHTFPGPDGTLKTETLELVEAATVYLGRPTSKKIPGYIYPTENGLREEQNKPAYLNY